METIEIQHSSRFQTNVEEIGGKSLIDIHKLYIYTVTGKMIQQPDAIIVGS